MTEPDEITLTLPCEREFQGVAHLVLGGLALRLNLTIEVLEDLQLALGAILDRAVDDGGSGREVTVRLALFDGVLETHVGPVDLDGELAADHEDLSLRRILWTVVDGVDVDGAWVRLTKRVNG
jgi:hypothetical protein